MYLTERIILQLYFPQFKSRTISRFHDFFLNLNKKDVKQKINQESAYTIFPDKIMQGEDKRTSIVFKNIPKIMRKKDIRSMIEKYANINFLTIRKDEKNEDYLNAFINVINYKSIVPIYMNLRKVNFNYKGNISNIQIIYCEIQGKGDLKKVFSNYFNK